MFNNPTDISPIFFCWLNESHFIAFWDLIHSLKHWHFPELQMFRRFSSHNTETSHTSICLSMLIVSSFYLPSLCYTVSLFKINACLSLAAAWLHSCQPPHSISDVMFNFSILSTLAFILCGSGLVPHSIHCCLVPLLWSRNPPPCLWVWDARSAETSGRVLQLCSRTVLLWQYQCNI